MTGAGSAEPPLEAEIRLDGGAFLPKSIAADPAVVRTLEIDCASGWSRAGGAPRSFTSHSQKPPSPTSQWR